MRISSEKLSAEGELTGFRPEVLEKVAHLLSLLDSFKSHPFLKGKLAIKGGTALNLFVFDVPRLSIDIDLNYVGAESREDMIQRASQDRTGCPSCLFTGGFCNQAYAGGTCRRQVVTTLSKCFRSIRKPRGGYQLHVPRSALAD